MTVLIFYLFIYLGYTLSLGMSVYYKMNIKIGISTLGLLRTKTFSTRFDGWTFYSNFIYYWLLLMAY